MHHIHRQISAVSRFQVKVFTQERENEDTFPFGEVVTLPKSRWRWLQRIIVKQFLRRPLLLTNGETKRLRVELRAHRCQLLHVFFGNTAVQLLPILGDPNRRYPAVVSFHGADVLVELDNTHYRMALLEVLGRVDLVLARSQSLQDALLKIGCPPEKLRLNRTGIPINKFPFAARVWPADGAWRLLQACRLIEKKGLGTSLKAFAEFANVYPNASLTIAGEGPEQPTLLALTAQLGLSGKVHFTGFLDQDGLRQQLYASHLFLHPSEQGADGNQEGIPNSLLEAMATGLPVFATRHGGIPEAVKHGVNGFLVPERDDAELAKLLLSATGNPMLLSQVSTAASKTVAEEFSLNAQVRKLEDYYQEAMEEAWLGAENAGVTEQSLGASPTSD